MSLIPSGTPLTALARPINALHAGLMSMNQTAQNLAIAQSSARRIGLADMRMHPFKVYVVPQIMSGADSATAWRTFRVRSGRVFLDPLKGVGCDYWDADPDSNFLPALDSSSQPLGVITVPTGTAAYYVWLNMGTPQSGDQQYHVTLHHGTTPTTDGWSIFPTPDSENLLIAIIDTSSGTPPAKIRQIIRSDVQSLPGESKSELLTCFKILEIFPDYLRCQKWNGVLSGSDVFVAKQLFARQSHTRQAVVDDTNYGFTYTNDNKRTTYVVGSATENSQIATLHETYQVGGSNGEDLLWAMKVNWTGVVVDTTTLTWLEILPHRIWGRKQVQA